MSQRKSLGESLVEARVISQEQLVQAQSEERRSGQRLRKVLVKLGFIEENDLVEFLARELGLLRMELNNILIDPKIIELVPEELARKYEIVPVLKIDNRITCAMVDPLNIFALDEIRAKTGLIIEPAVTTQDEIRKALDEHYGAKGELDEIIKNISAKHFEGREVNIKELENVGNEPVVIKLVNLVVIDAVKRGSSDIHIEPEENDLKIRLRIDGILREFVQLPKYLQSAVLSRVKLMAGLDIAERRSPQDGKFGFKIEEKEIDVRVSSVPTIHGENIVLRLLDVSKALLDMEELGFSKEILEEYQKLILRPHGIILVTGPTGSGKTTSLYSSLNQINTTERNIITIEDPVEYKLPLIRQIQVNPKVNLTFASGLRSILRQDPDIIMVGEIRDLETAEIAVQASLTGHLVFSTLHTNDAAATITRLIDMGVEPFLIASSVVCVLAQRLIRMICPACKEKYTPSAELLKDIGLPVEKKTVFYKGLGCSRCMKSGYKGRIGIYELMVIDEKLRNLITSKAAAAEIKKHAQSSGMLTLKEDGIRKIREGLTSVEEVLRVTQEE